MEKGLDGVDLDVDILGARDDGSQVYDWVLLSYTVEV